MAQSIKLKFNQDIRRTSIDVEQLPYYTLEVLKRTLSSLYGTSLPSSYTLEYTHDGKLVRISDDIQWAEAVSRAKGTTLVLTIIPIPPYVVAEESSAREQFQIFFEETLPEALSEGANGLKSLVGTLTSALGTVIDNMKETELVSQAPARMEEITEEISGFALKIKDTFDQAINKPRIQVSEPIKHNALCDHCDRVIVGVRYKCSSCDDFDLCETCEELDNIHERSHLFLKIKNVDLGMSDFQILEDDDELDCKFKFEKDVTIPDKHYIEPNTPFRKIWQVRNVGAHPWPANTSFHYVGGKNFAEIERVPLPCLKPQEVYEISVDMKSPSEPGLHSSFWNLNFPGVRMVQADRLWCTIVVPEPQVEDFKFQKELDSLLLMGFDGELARPLLEEFEGNLDSVINELLSQV